MNKNNSPLSSKVAGFRKSIKKNSRTTRLPKPKTGVDLVVEMKAMHKLLRGLISKNLITYDREHLLKDMIENCLNIIFRLEQWRTVKAKDVKERFRVCEISYNEYVKLKYSLRLIVEDPDLHLRGQKNQIIAEILNIISRADEGFRKWYTYSYETYYKAFSVPFGFSDVSPIANPTVNSQTGSNINPFLCRSESNAIIAGKSFGNNQSGIVNGGDGESTEDID